LGELANVSLGQIRDKLVCRSLYKGLLYNYNRESVACQVYF